MWIAVLKNPHLYSHPVDRFEIIETHISCVLLTGQFAYKIKKPVQLGFADFSTLEKLGEEELAEVIALDREPGSFFRRI